MPVKNIETKGFTTFCCDKCSKYYSFLNISQAETIKRIRAFGRFECEPCQKQEFRKKYKDNNAS